MKKSKKLLFRIELNYAFVQSGFWLAHLALQGFSAVFLAYKGFSNTQIGVTNSVMSVLSICFQLVVSSFSDYRSDIPIKKIMASLMLCSMIASAMLIKLPLSILLVAIVYTIGGGIHNTNSALINAQIMQYVNVGLDVNYGWPRGVGSMAYAIAAFILGTQLDKHSPSILMPLYILLILLTIIACLLMPNVSSVASKSAALYVQEKNSGRTTYLQILKGNRTLFCFLFASVLLYVGQTPNMLFLVKVVNSLGGGSKELGICMLIQSGVEMPAMFVAPALLKKYKARRLLLLSFIAYAVKMLIIAMSNSMSTIYIAMFLSLLCYGLYGVSASYFANDIVAQGEKVRAQGLVSLASYLGAIIGNLIAGVLIDGIGINALLHVSWVVLTFAAAIMFICARLDKKTALKL
ncbi:MAG TPA: MFS transporter [Christensenellaceae bacterium]|nr:MFS transporter [Christensenellaceae bacterium]